MESGSPPVSIDQLLAHADWVRWLARVLVSDDAAAEDVEQETWLEAIARPPATDAQPRHWLALVARNAARKLIRKQKSVAALEQLTARSEALPATDAVVARAALQQRVVAAVMQLAEPYRSTLLQRFFDQLPPRAIAAAANVSVETVKTRLKRGLALVRAHLQGDFEQEGRSWRLALLPLCRGPVAVPVVGSTVAGALGAFIVANGAKIGLMVAAVAIVAPMTWWMLTRSSMGSTTSETAKGADPAAASASVPVIEEAAPAGRTSEPVVTETTLPVTEEATAVSPETTGTIKGRVVDLAGQPVADATVYVGDQRESSFKDHESFINGIGGRFQVSIPPIHEAKAQSGSDGTFEVRGLDLFKTWSVGAGHRAAGCGFVTPVRFGAEVVERSVEIRLEGGISFVGTCTDPEGQPLRLTMVAIAMKLDDPSVRSNRYADFNILPQIQDDGTFATMAIPFRYFNVVASAFGGFVEKRIPWTRVPEDQREVRLDLRFERTVALTGRVVASDGSPANLATTLLPELSAGEERRQSRETLAVLAFSDDPRRDSSVLRAVDIHNPGTIGTGGRFAYGTLDLDHDRYTIERPPTEVRFIAVMARDELLGVAEIPPGSRGPDVPIDLAMLPESPLVRAVRFTATSAVTGKPLAGVQIDLFCYAVDEAGHSRCEMLRDDYDSPDGPPVVHELSLPIGTVVITISGYQFMRDHLWAEIPAGEEPLELTIALVPAGEASIRGEVVDGEGKPVANAPLRLYRKSDLKPVWEQTERMPGKTDDSGRFEFKELPALDYVVVAEGDDDGPSRDLAPAAMVVAATDTPEPAHLVLPRGVKCTLEVSSVDRASHGFRLRALTSDGLPLIDDFNHYWREYRRPIGRNPILLPPGISTLELTGPAGKVTSIPMDPSTATTAMILLPSD